MEHSSDKKVGSLLCCHNLCLDADSLKRYSLMIGAGQIADTPLFHLPCRGSARAKANKPPIHESSNTYILDSIVPAELAQWVGM